jgi:hypothetical protein
MNLFELFHHYLQLCAFTKIYICTGQEKSLVCLNRLQHGVLGHAPTIIFVCKCISPQNYSLPYYRGGKKSEIK